MKSSRSLARRYAQALLMLAIENNSLDQYEEELEIFAGTLEAEPRLQAILSNPQVSPEAKKELLEKISQGRLSPMVINFLYLIVDKKRETYYSEISKEFSRYADEARNIVDAEVRSVVTLTEKDFRSLEARLAKATGKKVRLRSVIDPELIGGLIVLIGDTIIDGSVAKRLSLLRKNLQHGRFEGIGVIK